MSASLPAAWGGEPMFPTGLPLVRPRVERPRAVAERLAEALESGLLTNGPRVAELEERVAAFVGTRYAVAVSSCTAGLMLVLSAVGRGRVVLPSFTFAASAHAVHWTGGVPDFVELDRESLTVDATAVAAVAHGAAAVLATHVYGTPCDVEALDSVSRPAGVPVVYDAAHALGSAVGGRRVGGFGAAEVFSLSPTKVTIAGEGGLVTTNDESIARHCRIGRDYGNPGDYDCEFPGLNARMSELHATVALASLEGLPDRLMRRARAVRLFADAVAGLPGARLPALRPGDTSTHKDLTLVIDAAEFGLGRDALRAALAAEGIETRAYFSPPVHRQRAYAHLPERYLPVTDQLAASVVTLPLWSDMADSQIQALADAVLRIHAHVSALIPRFPVDSGIGGSREPTLVTPS